MGWDQAVTAIITALDNAGQMGFNYQQADKNRKLAQWAHTYEVADLKNAGLNPILSASGGGGARPPGSTPGPSLENMATTALQARNLSAQTKKLEADALKTTTENKILSKEVPAAEAIHDVSKTLIDRVRQTAADHNPLKNPAEKGGKSLVPYLIEKGVNSAKKLPNLLDDIKTKVNTFFDPKTSHSWDYLKR